MAKAIEVPKYVQKSAAYVDLMQHGSGTPWEDRGGVGVIAGFFKTVIRGISAPATLWESLRRPETTDDAKWFAIGCGIFWSLGVVVNDLLRYRRMTDPAAHEFTGDTSMLGIVIGLKFLLCPLILFFFVQMTTGLYHRMVSHTMKYKAPPSLTFNLFTYSLGPSLFAIIPLAGMPIAALWILMNMIRSGIVRQRITAGSSVIAAIIAVAVCALIIFGGFYILHYFVLDNMVFTAIPKPVPRPGQQ